MQKITFEVFGFASFVIGCGMNIVAPLFPSWSGWLLIVIGILACIYGILPKKWQFRKSDSRDETIFLEIIFDPKNPHKRFWDFVPEMDGYGKPTGKLCREYRIMVKNNSMNTIRNVKAEIMINGKLPQLPKDLVYKKDGSTAKDLEPKHAEFIPIIWTRSPQAGDAWGETARLFYSPLIVIARGDGVLPTTCSFNYCPDDVPALIEITK